MQPNGNWWLEPLAAASRRLQGLTASVPFRVATASAFLSRSGAAWSGKPLRIARRVTCFVRRLGLVGNGSAIWCTLLGC